jgi:hypothetical protein
VSRWNLHHGVVPFSVFLMVWHNFYRGENKTRDSGSTVAPGSVAPLPLWSQNRKPDVRMTSIQRQGGRFWMKWRSTKSVRMGEASATYRGVVSGPRAPVFGKKHVELFLVCTVARVLFYQCSPYSSIADTICNT